MPDFPERWPTQMVSETGDRVDPHQPTEGLSALVASGAHLQVVRFFNAQDANVATLDELAAELVECDGTVEDPSEARIVLHHRVLPRLDATGAIEYDHRSSTVRYRCDPHLETLVS